MARHVATSAGCCTSVSTRSSSGESKQSFWRSRPGRLAAEPVDVHRSRDRLGELAAHAGLERALARETESDLAHLVLLRVSSSPAFTEAGGPPHSINAEPHVRPAPIPVINTSAPSASRPSARASASASGIDPEDVFPNRSTLTTVRSGGMPSLPTA